MEKTACKFSLLVALFFFLAFSPVWADGNGLLQKCLQAQKFLDDDRASVNETEAAFCIGIVEGVRDTMRIYEQLMSSRQGVPEEWKKTCWPEKPSTGQTVRVVVKYLRDNPKELHLPDSLLIVAAFREAFKCK